MTPERNHPFKPRQTNSWSRREWLRVGGLGALGVSLPQLLRGNPNAAAISRAASFGRAKSCIILFLSGGPPQHETFDPKPGTTNGGPTLAIDTPVNGIRIAGREKTLYSIYQKMTNKHLSFAQVTDIYGFRLVLPDVIVGNTEASTTRRPRPPSPSAAGRRSASSRTCSAPSGRCGRSATRRGAGC